MKIWDWCLDTFQPYLGYAENKNDLTHAILRDIGHFPEDFPAAIVSYMEEHPRFIEKLILCCSDTLCAVGDLIAAALREYGDGTAVTYDPDLSRRYAAYMMQKIG